MISSKILANSPEDSTLKCGNGDVAIGLRPHFQHIKLGPVEGITKRTLDQKKSDQKLLDTTFYSVVFELDFSLVQDQQVSLWL